MLVPFLILCIACCNTVLSSSGERSYFEPAIAADAGTCDPTVDIICEGEAPESYPSLARQTDGEALYMLQLSASVVQRASNTSNTSAQVSAGSDSSGNTSALMQMKAKMKDDGVMLIFWMLLALVLVVCVVITVVSFLEGKAQDKGEQGSPMLRRPRVPFSRPSPPPPMAPMAPRQTIGSVDGTKSSLTPQQSYIPPSTQPATVQPPGTQQGDSGDSLKDLSVVQRAMGSTATPNGRPSQPAPMNSSSVLPAPMGTAPMGTVEQTVPVQQAPPQTAPLPPPRPPQTAPVQTGTKPPPLCPALVLPNFEAKFAVTMDSLKTSTGSFEIFGLSGNPLLRAVVRQSSGGQLVDVSMTPAKSPSLATFGLVTDGQGTSLQVTWPDGRPYGRLKLTSPGQYALSIGATEAMNVLMESNGQMSITATGNPAVIASATRGDASESTYFQGMDHLEFRVNPGVDAVLLLCCFLAIALFGDGPSDGAALWGKPSVGSSIS